MEHVTYLPPSETEMLALAVLDFDLRPGIKFPKSLCYHHWMVVVLSSLDGCSFWVKNFFLLALVMTVTSFFSFMLLLNSITGALEFSLFLLV